MSRWYEVFATIVSVRLVKFLERQDNGQHYTAADRWLTHQVTAWQGE